MANKIQVKRSAVPAKVPTTGDLDLGELAINTYDGVIYLKKDNGTASIVQVGGGGSGDVVGPSSATDNAVARFNSTTGKLIQNSGVTIDDNSNVTANTSFQGFTSVAASGTQITLTIASTPFYTVTGSGGQVIQLPNATTLPNGAMFSFNNNQSSGAINVNNNSGTLVVSIPSGGYVTVTLLSNASSAGSWDRHDQAPANVSWSTNTFDYAGSITSATWNGTAVAINRGGTGQATATAAFNALSPVTTTGDLIVGNGTNSATRLAIGANGYLLTSNGTTATWSAAPSGMIYPGAGIPVSTGTAWTTSKTSPSGTIVGTTDTQTLTNKQWQAYNETCTTVGTVSSGTYNIDLSLSNIFDITLGANVTFTFTNPPSSGISRNCTVILRQDATGSRLATFTNAKYTDGTAPILSTGANQIDVLTFFTLNGGSFWFGTFAMANVS